jgi:hypothetical protein
MQKYTNQLLTSYLNIISTPSFIRFYRSKIKTGTQIGLQLTTSNNKSHEEANFTFAKWFVTTGFIQ